MQSLSSFRKELKLKADPKRAKGSGRFFKTGPGEYGEGHLSMGVLTSEKRKIAKKYKDLKLGDLEKLLKSKIHDERQIALFILVCKYQSASLEGSKENQQKVFNFYLKNTKYVNNWDLVDLSAPKIIGEYLAAQLKNSNTKTRQILYKLARSKNLWERRIAIISTYAFIRQNKFEDTLKIAKMLLNDKHDLIHKAVGWMLRETGKRSQPALEKFLKAHYKNMPRTMLRYAIEKFPEKKRKMYLNGGY